ncbi:MAG: DoxX family protein [Armatimonadota bacterium]|nr:DoxX family protein [Armatimonadota bacterium]
MDMQTAPAAHRAHLAGNILSGFAATFLAFDGVMKLANPAPVMEAMQQLGYADSAAFGIGLLLIACTILYVIPRTAVLGAILLTGYLGGATASHVRVQAGLFPILFPAIFGLLVWAGLYLRDDRLRSLLPLRK